MTIVITIKLTDKQEEELEMIAEQNDMAFGASVLDSKLTEFCMDNLSDFDEQQINYTVTKNAV